MIHGRQSDRCGDPPQGGPPGTAAPEVRAGDAPCRRGGPGPGRAGARIPLRPGGRALVAGLALAVLAVAGCGDNGATPPGTIRFGQVGSLQVRLEAPLRLGQGQLLQVIRWRSNGVWSLEETISYEGLVGDERVLGSPASPAVYAGAYAELNTLINDTGKGLGLFIDELPQDLEPQCGPTRTRVTVEVTDELQEETAAWTRCADGSLTNLTPRDAGPDPAASRVVEVARIARNGTVGEGFVSQYAGSVPFGTLDRGQDTPSGVRTPAVFTAEEQWVDFWEQHAPGTEAPAVDFAEAMVVAGIVGMRREAGDSVEVRRIFQVDQGTLVEIWERVPGDFCTPADRTHVPYHIVVSPRTPDPVRFGDVRVETVPCGG